MEESIFLNEGSVSVSNSRFIVDGQTYAMSNVTSVKPGFIDIKRGETVFVGAIGLACLFGSGIIFLIGLVFIAAAAIYLMVSKPQFTVVLNTSSGETQALASEDKEYIERVLGALNKAIVIRG